MCQIAIIISAGISELRTDNAVVHNPLTFVYVCMYCEMYVL